MTSYKPFPPRGVLASGDRTGLAGDGLHGDAGANAQEAGGRQPGGGEAPGGRRPHLHLGV